MSCWTYLDGVIKVSSPGRTQAECEYILKSVLAHLPLVTGSEGDMNVNILPINGYNISSSTDEYGDSTNNLVNRHGCHDHKSGWLKIQDTFQIVVQGNLRDREFKQTYKEFVKWLCRLAKRVYVEDVLVRISENYSGRYEIINDSLGVYSSFKEYSSWVNDTGEPSWVEHLMWKPAKDSNVPLDLLVKYYSDEEYDAEFKRRNRWRRGK